MMKSTNGRLLCRLLLIGAAILGVAALHASPVWAAPSGTVTSASTPSNAAPSIGQQITVTINVDMSAVDPPDNYLGSFTGSLDWDPGILTYSSHSGPLGGFSGLVNTTNVAAGHIIFNGASATGATGNIVVLTVVFDVAGTGTSDLHLAYTAMAAAGTFGGLKPILTITDGQVVVSALPGDLDHDCDVDIVDIMMVASRWNTRPGDPDYDPRYDLDGDGDIDIVDIMQIAVNWGTHC